MDKLKAGIWIHASSHFGDSSSDIGEGLKKLKDAGFTLLIPCIKNPDGLLDYHTKIGKIRESFKTWDPLEEICNSASKLNLKVHPWLCVFTEGKDSAFIQKNPDTWLIDYEGKKGGLDNKWGWVCAMKPEVQEYELSLYNEILENYPVEGVHLDYIRTGKVCLCEYCKAEIKRKTGLDPSEIRNNEHGEPVEIWMNWREKNITHFVAEVSKKAKKMKKEVSAAVFPGYPGCLEVQGQNWKEWADKKLVDYIIPMSYTNNLALFAEYVRVHKCLISPKKASLWEGIGRKSSGCCLSPLQLQSQLQEALKSRLEGVVIFSYSGLKPGDFHIFKKFFC